MEHNLLERLKALGYTKEQATQLIQMYDKQRDIEALLAYVETKESFKESTATIL